MCLKYVPSSHPEALSLLAGATTAYPAFTRELTIARSSGKSNLSCRAGVVQDIIVHARLEV